MQRKHNRDGDESIVAVSLDLVKVPQRMFEKLMRKDRGQIEEMRSEIENGRTMVPVVLRPNIEGGYDIEDGRHRVVAAKLACASFIEAVILGD